MTRISPELNYGHVFVGGLGSAPFLDRARDAMRRQLPEGALVTTMTTTEAINEPERLLKAGRGGHVVAHSSGVNAAIRAYMLEIMANSGESRLPIKLDVVAPLIPKSLPHFAVGAFLNTTTETIKHPVSGAKREISSLPEVVNEARSMSTEPTLGRDIWIELEGIRHRDVGVNVFFMSGDHWTGDHIGDAAGRNISGFTLAALPGTHNEILFNPDGVFGNIGM